MKREKMIQYMDLLDEKYIAEADPANAKNIRNKKIRSTVLRYGSIAACLLCTIIIGISVIQKMEYPSVDTGDPVDTIETGDTNHEYYADPGTSDGLTHSYYLGPVFPLTAAEANPELSITREVNYDFSPYKSAEKAAIVNDAYTLTNTSNEDRIFTLRYPVILEFASPQSRLPNIRLNDEILNVSIAENQLLTEHTRNMTEDFLNHQMCSSWAEMFEILQKDSFDDITSVFQPVIVYEFSGYNSESNDTRHVWANFSADSDNTIVYTLGFNGSSFDDANQKYSKIFSVNQSQDSDKYLIVVGEDIQDISMHGDDENTPVYGNINRYESDLRSFLLDKSESFFEYTWRNDEFETVYDIISPDQKIQNILEIMYMWAGLQSHAASRYDNGLIEDIIADAYTLPRILYFEFNVEIPAGDTVKITADMTKDASVHYGKGNETNGYDLVTSLDQNLRITEQKALIHGSEHIDIINQNFGFDLDAGITEVNLAVENIHYWMEIQYKDATN